MPNMKKVAILLSLSLTVLMLAGCAGNPAPSVGFETQTIAPETEAPTIPNVTVPGLTSEHHTPESSSETEDGEETDLSKVIALTFDDGPDMRYTSSTGRILDVLEQYDCKATFFVQTVQLTYNLPCNEETGETFAERNKALVAREHELGMEIGSHSFDHPDFNKLSAGEISEQLSRANSMIREITGEDIKIIRTPYGSHEQNVLDAVDYPIILWEIDTMDWDTKDPDNTYNEIMRNIKGGDIVLMHDIYGTTADAVERVVPDLVAQGYKLVTVSEMFRLYGKPLEGHHFYCNAR